MLLIIPVEAKKQNKGGVILYDPQKNEILKQYVHNRKWKRVGWRGGIVYGKYLIGTDWNQLHYFNLKTWEYEKSFNKNTFNDLHYLRIAKKKLYIVNTGLDAIEIFNNPLNPEFEQILFLFDVAPKLFSKRNINLNMDFGGVYKTNPHSAHPNCIEFCGKRVLVTCFRKGKKNNTGEAILLNNGKKLFRKCYDCHDGNFYKNDYYVTRTRFGTILVYKDIKAKKIPVYKPDETLSLGSKGWWRGMVIHNDIIYIILLQKITNAIINEMIDNIINKYFLGDIGHPISQILSSLKLKKLFLFIII